MEPVIVFPDAQLAVRNVLRELIPAAEHATVSTREITGSDNDWHLPYIQVRTDGSYRDSHLNGRSTVRIICYGVDEGDSLRLAALCEGILLAADSNEQLRGCNPIMGPYATTDPDNDLPFAYFTVTARLRPHTVTI